MTGDGSSAIALISHRAAPSYAAGSHGDDATSDVGIGVGVPLALSQFSSLVSRITRTPGAKDSRAGLKGPHHAFLVGNYPSKLGQVGYGTIRSEYACAPNIFKNYS